MNLFPYTPRKNQIAIMQTIKNILVSEGDIVFESGTGSGKTICTLSSTLEYALENNKKIIYTTRTNAQQRQVILELRAIRNKNKDIKEKILVLAYKAAQTCVFLLEMILSFPMGHLKNYQNSVQMKKRKPNLLKKTKIKAVFITGTLWIKKKLTAS